MQWSRLLAAASIAAHACYVESFADVFVPGDLDRLRQAFLQAYNGGFEPRVVMTPPRGAPRVTLHSAESPLSVEMLTY